MLLLSSFAFLYNYKDTINDSRVYENTFYFFNKTYSWITLVIWWMNNINLIILTVNCLTQFRVIFNDNLNRFVVSINCYICLISEIAIRFVEKKHLFLCLIFYYLFVGVASLPLLTLVSTPFALPHLFYSHSLFSCFT